MSADPVTITLPDPRVVEYRGGHSYDEDGALYPSEWTYCRVCTKSFEEDQPIRKVGVEWLHEDCAIGELTGADADRAWLMLADLIAARPSAFRAADIKAVLRNVAAIARRTSPVFRG